MASYRELREQLRKLGEEVETARLAELQTVIEDVRAKIVEYSLTAEDIFGRQRKQGGARKTPLPPRYRDSKTGATWSGRGREPRWIKGKKRDRFLIEP
ncbi:H-NS histone family protein [Paraburkholderia sp. J41]|uniref:H-NS histone family protein n=1 Tax=Paraburkholderia sp. J41 TaxID=2805433 RepID=UPI002AC35364|nr:H-NS histone family protein [Paraburkholderia sp. J41]